MADLQLSERELDQLANALVDRAFERIGAGSLAMTVKQAAAACGLHEKTIRRAIDAGELSVVRVGTRVLILRSDLEAWLIARRVNRSAGRRRENFDPARAVETPSGSLQALYDQHTSKKRPRTAPTAGGMAHRRQFP